jgi:hypothetical protein
MWVASGTEQRGWESQGFVAGSAKLGIIRTSVQPAAASGVRRDHAPGKVSVSKSERRAGLRLALYAVEVHD